MEPITSSIASQPAVGTAGAHSFAELGSDDFLNLLITQLRNQDPLEPVGNEELLQQISSVREIELSTTLTESLRMLTGQQRFSSASSFIGQHVTGLTGEDGLARSGVVVGVRFTDAGQAILLLADGNELPLDQVSSIESPRQAAEMLIGQAVFGVDRREPGDPKMVEGIVTGVRSDPSGEVVLELDSGQDLRFRDFVGIAPSEAA